VRLIRDIDALPEQIRGGALSIGNFDGVHRGHARLAERLVRSARCVDGPAVVFTFDPSPTKILHPEAAPALLSWIERRAELLGGLGVDAVVAYPTDHALLELTPEQFFRRIIVEKLGARAMVEGSNFRFGHRRAGDTAKLRELCQAEGIDLDVVEPIELLGHTVSSSRIRRLIAAGDLEAVNRMLTEPYRIRGIVSYGSRRGNTLGYPTANVERVDNLLPGEGIYAGRAYVDGRAWGAAVSVGPNPTFGEVTRKVEAFLLDFQGDLYGRPLQVEFVARLRDIVRFDSRDELIAQMDVDVEQTRRMLGLGAEADAELAPTSQRNES